ncbi:hypothetical protein [Sphingomonas bacterium]|uniref:hypothetical protein n=1 Tax=Sphingomonas bacterium TaxID=1895847 RepID=UPI001576743F|nr:hypothetical protein [Sphingomonas bacterium]
MNFGISGGSIGFIGAIVLFGALMIAFTIVATIVIRVVRGRDDEASGGSTGSGDDRAAEDDYIL